MHSHGFELNAVRVEPPVATVSVDASTQAAEKSPNPGATGVTLGTVLLHCVPRAVREDIVAEGSEDIVWREVGANLNLEISPDRSLACPRASPTTQRAAYMPFIHVMCVW